MREQGIKNFDDELLADVFSGTMTFLYRLMFILYAESLELLPLNEVRGYREGSLYRIKQEIKDAGGDVSDEASDKLAKKYRTDGFDLYQRLTELFGVIDIGSDELNVPTYNGGLFSRETESGTFLNRYGVPDRYLALGLDRLTRDIDDRTQALVFIDFKSLGVRQLGSIYEGLLEFKLKMAAEKLAVKKEKGKEVYQPAAKVKKPLFIIEKGEVYLENDKRERKATGSYYTPDYIVKYIVQHTVGPVLDRKFDELRPRLREAQKQYQQARKVAEQRGEDPEKFWELHEPRSAMSQLVDDCLNVRALDPAMGSGHFLVEVVDFVSNRLIDFLNGWSQNPVWAVLERTRNIILDEMEKQHVTIDADRLTRVALLKRAVLKRCVYGVDLNAMAVELAKVSLWLDAFTLGAPLSFLDHHLKHGNSLIGSRVKDVQEALEGAQTLFSQNKFAGVMLATDLMRQVSYLSDNTIEQTRQSVEAYQAARDHLAPFKRVLDVYTSRWFGNTPTKAKRGKGAFDPTIEFLRRDDTQAWLEDPRKPENRLPADDYMKAGLVAKQALAAAKEKHFFHWELEFPEVFFAPRTPGGQDVQLKEDGGFDAVVGNPPYVSNWQLTERDEKLPDQLAQVYPVVSTGHWDLYVLFIYKGVTINSPSGSTSFIVPSPLTTEKYATGIRNYVINHCRLFELVMFGEHLVFDEVSRQYTIFRIGPTSKNDNLVSIKHFEDGKFLEKTKFPQITFQTFENSTFRTDITQEHLIIRQKVEGASLRFGTLCAVNPGVVAHSRKGSPIKFAKDDVIHIENPLDDYKHYIGGDDLSRYDIQWNGLYMDYASKRDLFHRPKFPELFDSEKIMFRGVSGAKNTLIAVYDNKQYYTNHAIQHAVRWTPRIIELQPPGNINIHPDAAKYDLRYVCAIISSYVTSAYFDKYLATGTLQGSYTSVYPEHIRSLPVYRIDFKTSSHERKQLAGEIVGAYDLSDNAGMLHRVQEVLGANQTDVVHDVLAHLAQRMIDLNKDKQAEIKRFLGWLEDRLNILPKDGKTGFDTFSGKTIIQNYLGDYQKGERQLPWDEFHYRLYQNRNRFSVSLGDVEGEIQRAFEDSLNVLIPIKDELARTDALIDKIVYRLYGLTDEEIELIERPQYEQALSDAKAKVVADEQIEDEEERIEKIADDILPAAKRFFERVEPKSVEAELDQDLPNWHQLPPDAPIFLVTGDYNLRSLPDHMDFSSSVIPYAKAIETVLEAWIFEPFRNTSGYTDRDCENAFLKQFMRGDRKLTLGSFMIILSSSKETALRRFINGLVSDASNRFFGNRGLVEILNDDEMRDIRNKAAHAEAVGRDEAAKVREWTLAILGLV